MDFGPAPYRTMAHRGNEPIVASLCTSEVGMRSKEMDDRDNSVMEAGWLLAVPVSLALTVLLAGLLLT
ncbi:hypothetical protein AJ88_16450 [Mesorhizobium amorphae CCBAU 01583]|nr:hypothetical protein AJ88_16515 [Mesorhizobium amorphae CCBAU 01583]OWK21347.1 hypothetical protein AJ88_16450 [Mesorhizobium amorphae CCBAU 01583]